MKKYICKEVPTENGCYLEIEKELILCEDCEDCTETGFYNGIRWNYCQRFRRVMKEDDFCSRAKPKENKDE